MTRKSFFLREKVVIPAGFCQACHSFEMNGGPIKVLHVVHSLVAGGMENGLVNVARRLDPADFEVHVCCLEKGGDFAERLPDPKKICILNKPAGWSAATVFGLAKVMARVKPDVIHTHNLGPLIYTGLATGMGAGRQILHGEHGFPQGLFTRRSLRQRRWFYHACKKVHTVSSGLREALVSSGLPAEKIVVVLNGVDGNRFTFVPAGEARRRIQLPAEGPVLGIVGRFDRLKGHLALIEAFEGVLKKFPTAQLLAVGKGGEIWNEIEQRIRESPAVGHIHLVGLQKEPEHFYQAMDLLVSPSLAEGLSNVVLEAMACGVPSLAHTGFGNEEMITHNKDGLVSGLESAEKLRTQLEMALADPLRLARLGRAARETAVNRFSMSGMVDKYARLYRDLAARR